MAKKGLSLNVGFALLRVVGVGIVVLDHSFPLTNLKNPTLFPPAWHIAPGYIALMGLFAMSGYQVSDSWGRDPSWWRFTARRVLRIFPPLMVLAAITVLVLGPLHTVWPLADYWSSDLTWSYLFLTPLVFPLRHELPGVFIGNPYPWSVNGSLWTLPMELLGYVLVLGLGLAIAIGVSRIVLLPLLAGLFVLNTRYGATTLHPGDAGSFAELIPIGPTVALLIPFLIGMTMYNFRDRIPLHPVPAIMLFVAWLALNETPAGPVLLPIMAGYGCVVLAHRLPPGLKRARNWLFCSYGMYLWGFLMQQVIVAAGVRDPWLLIVLVLPASYLCGILSWRLVEEPTLELRSYLRKPKPKPVPQPEPPPTPESELSGLLAKDQMA